MRRDLRIQIKDGHSSNVGIGVYEDISMWTVFWKIISLYFGVKWNNRSHIHIEIDEHLKKEK